MKLTVRLTALLCLASGLGFADSWSGVLVDSKCYASEESNVNPDDTDTYVDRDRNFELRYCHPTARTKSFAIVQESGESLKLDSASDAKAAEIARNGDKKANVFVAVTGERNKRTIQVNSISLVR
jgi:hypothetical protein